MTRIHGGVRQVQRVRPVRLLKWKRLADVNGLEFGSLDGLEKGSSTFIVAVGSRADRDEFCVH